jgi:MFS family permease
MREPITGLKGRVYSFYSTQATAVAVPVPDVIQSSTAASEAPSPEHPRPAEILCFMPSLILSVYLPTLILSLCRGLLLPVLPVYVSSFGISYSLIGLLLAGEAIGMLIADIPAGGVLRRFGRKWTMLLGVSLVGVSVAALFWTISVWVLLGLRVITGMGEALWNLSRHAYLTEATLSAERGRALALFGGTTRLGVFLGPAIGGVIAATFGIRAPFLLFAALCAVAFLIVVLFLERTTHPPTLRPHASPASGKHPLLAVLREYYRVLLIAGSGQLLAQMIRASRQVIVPLYGAGVLGLDLQTIGLIMSVSSFIDMSMFYPAGVLMDRFGRKHAIVPSFLLQALGMALLPLSTGATALLVFTSIIGLGNGLGSGTMMTLGSDLAPRETLGEFLGVWRLIGDGGSVGAPLMVGGVADTLDLPTAAWVMACVGLVAAGVFAFGVPETLGRAEPGV